MPRKVVNLDNIASSSLSKSEIVLPVGNALGEIIAVLDVDSEMLNQFDDIDAKYLAKIIKLIN